MNICLEGRYAVGIHGYVRAKNNLDVWIGVSAENARNVDRALREFGFSNATLSPQLFMSPGQIVRMGVPPLRLELLTGVSGVEFAECYNERELFDIDGISVPVISLHRLRENKAAANRPKDVADLDNLPH